MDITLVWLELEEVGKWLYSINVAFYSVVYTYSPGFMVFRAEILR